MYIYLINKYILVYIYIFDSMDAGLTPSLYNHRANKFFSTR